MFYEVKMSKDDAYLVTGNIKHFPKLAQAIVIDSISMNFI